MPNFGMSEREADAVAGQRRWASPRRRWSPRASGRATAARTAALADGPQAGHALQLPGLPPDRGRRATRSRPSITDPRCCRPTSPPRARGCSATGCSPTCTTRSRVRMRPWLTVRMPTFDFTDDQAQHRGRRYFAAREQRRAVPLEPPAADAAEPGGGRGGLQHVPVRQVPSRPAPRRPQAAGGSTGDLAPSLLLAHDRLRYDWVPLWIKNPQSWIPGTRMPSNFPEAEPGKFTLAGRRRRSTRRPTRRRRQQMPAVLRVRGGDEGLPRRRRQGDDGAARPHLEPLRRRLVGAAPAKTAAKPAKPAPAAKTAKAAEGRADLSGGRYIRRFRRAVKSFMPFPGGLAARCAIIRRRRPSGRSICSSLSNDPQGGFLYEQE